MKDKEGGDMGKGSIDEANTVFLEEAGHSFEDGVVFKLSFVDLGRVGGFGF